MLHRLTVNGCSWRLLRTFAKVDAELGAAAVKAVELLTVRKKMELWARFLRHLNVELGFIRTVDALRYALENQIHDAFHPPGMSQDEWHKCVDFLPHLKIGHLVPFAQMVPRFCALFLAFLKLESESSFLQSLFLCTLP